MVTHILEHLEIVGLIMNQANNDGAYLLVINDEDEFDFIKNQDIRFVGYYYESGTGYALPGLEVG